METAVSASRELFVEQIYVLILSELPTLSLDSIAAISPDIRVIDGRHKFDQEIRERWPRATVDRYFGRPTKVGGSTQTELEHEKARQERDMLLAQADVACIGFPYPLELVSRAPRLKWVHHTAAAASNLRFGDIWGSSIIVTTSRGHRGTVPIAEYVIAAVLAFAKQLPRAFGDQKTRHLSRRDYRPVLLQGKTIGIVGLGGIGREVARLAKALGMRVLATRRSALVRSDGVEGVDTLFPPQDLDGMLAQCDFVALCAQYTTETESIMGEAQFHAMKPGAYLVNVARGELIDEDALVRALHEGWIAGAALDVYAGEFQKSPRSDFRKLANLILTPHISGFTDVSLPDVAELFYENLKRFISSSELLNVVDWKRGY